MEPAPPRSRQHVAGTGIGFLALAFTFLIPASAEVVIDLGSTATNERILRVPAEGDPVAIRLTGAYLHQESHGSPTQYAFEFLKQLSEQLDLNVTEKLQRVRKDAAAKVAAELFPKSRQRLDSFHTYHLCEKAEAVIRRAGAGAETFWKDWINPERSGGGEWRPMEYAFTAYPGINETRTFTFNQVYRMSDLEKLMQQMVQAAQLYLKTVSDIERQVREEMKAGYLPNK